MDTEPGVSNSLHASGASGSDRCIELLRLEAARFHSLGTIETQTPSRRTLPKTQVLQTQHFQFSYASLELWPIHES